MNPKEQGLVGPQVVFALYRPHDGKDEELRRLIAEHVPTLRRLELITDRPAILVKSRNGTYIEVFEWSTPDASARAHHHPEVAKVWESMGQVCDLPPLDTLEETKARFAHFQPVNL
jgi:hypothetical protein